jgi:hypothetical protein
LLSILGLVFIFAILWSYFDKNNEREHLNVLAVVSGLVFIFTLIYGPLVNQEFELSAEKRLSIEEYMAVVKYNLSKNDIDRAIRALEQISSSLPKADKRRDVVNEEIARLKKKQLESFDLMAE